MASRALVSCLYQRVLASFPKQHLRMAFAYGSGVFQQQGHADMSKNMLDFIFVVDDPVEWHRLNMSQNYSHYSFLKLAGPEAISKIQDSFGARIYFNTLVPWEQRLIKYGVIKTDSLVNDLFDWETLYVSGRLHKPIKVIYREMEDTSELRVAMATNLSSAVHTALLLLDETFTEEELYLTIAGLSYAGDFRMTVGEDRNKVENIVKPNLERFRELYTPVLEADEHVHWRRSVGVLEQSLERASQYHHLNLLPLMLQVGLVNHRNVDGRTRDTEDVLSSFATDAECRSVLRRCMQGIVKQSSLSQSAKGILTAGLSKSFRYSLSKLRKMWKSKKKR